MHLADPVAQRVHHQLEHLRLRHVEGVAAAGDVGVAAPAVGSVVGAVVVAAEADGRAVDPALGGVVVDHVEDDLEAGRVQVLDHLLELGDLPAARTARRVRRRAARRSRSCCSPSSWTGRARRLRRLGQEVLHGQQLDRGDAEVDEVVDDRRVAEPRVSAALVLRHVRVEAGEALDMCLVDHGALPRHVGPPVVAPVEAVGADDHAARGVGRRVGVGSARRAGSGPRATGAGVSWPSMALAYGSSSSLLHVEQPARGWVPTGPRRGSRTAGRGGHSGT